MDEQLTNTRLNKHSEEIDDLKLCVKELKTIVELQNQQMVKIQQDQEQRIRSLESKGGDMMDKVLGFFLGAIISGVVGFIFYTVGMK